ncbi:hypothetical protein GJAV_G00100990 [Gymnothorax javanicus]|nr:hypothetical protein GJAV_G00100990 [Gymnothorax javanicus]
MFGRKPQLPVDFLLGLATDDLGNASPADWVATHMEYLEKVYANTKNRLEAAASSCECNSLPQLPLQTRVCRRSHPLGWHKIQDLWDPRVYRVVKCWNEKGQVYHITPEDGLSPDINVHRSELKVLPNQERQQGEAPADTRLSGTTDEQGGSENDEEDGDVWFQVAPNQRQARAAREVGQMAGAAEQPNCNADPSGGTIKKSRRGRKILSQLRAPERFTVSVFSMDCHWDVHLSLWDVDGVLAGQW